MAAGAVGELLQFVVPLEPLAGEAIRHRADEHGLGKWAAMLEVVACLAAIEDGIHPVVIVVLRLQVGRVFLGWKTLLPAAPPAAPLQYFLKMAPVSPIQ